MNTELLDLFLMSRATSILPQIQWKIVRLANKFKDYEICLLSTSEKGVPKTLKEANSSSLNIRQIEKRKNMRLLMFFPKYTFQVWHQNLATPCVVQYLKRKLKR